MHRMTHALSLAGAKPHTPYMPCPRAQQPLRCISIYLLIHPRPSLTKPEYTAIGSLNKMCQHTKARVTWGQALPGVVTPALTTSKCHGLPTHKIEWQR